MSTQELVQRIDDHLRTLTEEIRTLEAARDALRAGNGLGGRDSGGAGRRGGRPPATSRATRRTRGAVSAEQVHALLPGHGSVTTSALAEQTGADATQVLRALRELESRGHVRRTGARRGTRWHAVTDEDRIRARAAELEARTHPKAASGESGGGEH
jgi:predicted Rossmann fold nucleotide-binding protein DprA/Smf involved in DNA uptake